MTVRLHPAARASLRHSMKDGVASSITTGVTDHYLNAYALLLFATPAQVGWLASLPSLIGALTQLLAAWLARRGAPRLPLIVGGAVAQATCLLPLLVLPFVEPEWAVPALIAAVVLYRVTGNLVLPLWQSLMGDLVPERRRGRFFARRNRLATVTAFVALAGGGTVLELSGEAAMPWVGFLLLFAIAAVARLVSAWHLRHMHDPGQSPPDPTIAATGEFRPRHAFVRFALFVAAMQGAVAIAGPFFAVHMLRDIGLSYLEFMAVLAASVLAQFATLNAWGLISDRFGNHLVLKVTAWMVPLLPPLWMVSDSVWWLLAIQLVGGLAWGGFSLSSGNYLYDLRGGRPRTTMFALSAVVSSVAVCLGALLGGYLADRVPQEITVLGEHIAWSHPLYGLFMLSAGLRVAVAAVLMRGLAEPRRVEAGGVRQVFYRLARFNSITGVAFDLVATARRVVEPQQGERPIVHER